MQKVEKQEFVKNFNETLKNKEFLVVAHYKGLTVSEISSLRQKIKSANSIFKVAKNTLSKRALKNTDFEILDKLFVGPTSVAYSDDPVSTSKAMIDFAKENQNLKKQINELLEREERLRQKIADLKAAAYIGRRGLPWR